MSRKTEAVKVPCGKVLVDIRGRRIGAGKTATVYAKAEPTQVHKVTATVVSNVETKNIEEAVNAN
ncbi:MAG: hypothetical protein U9N61_01630 [Euryarchaeota archaeon]|nr:hypothetical protein [Euryarchaeota archaeon]